jgi:hypothetical protein
MELVRGVAVHDELDRRFRRTGRHHETCCQELGFAAEVDSPPGGDASSTTTVPGGEEHG